VKGNSKENKKVGSVLVVGGGIAGIQSALDLVNSGFKVYLVEKGLSIGGVMAQLDKTFPTNDCAMCILSPKLVEVGRHPNIELITNADIQKVEGSAGNFRVLIKKKARFVNERCIACGRCAEACVLKDRIPNEFDLGLRKRSAIYIPFPQAVPLKYAIDPERCLFLSKDKCKQKCLEACDAEAINFEQQDEDIELDVGAIILATGCDEFDAKLKSEYGYGHYPNVVSSIEFERIQNASGPYGGVIQRPSDMKKPKRIAFIQCIGSRDSKSNEYCSSVCCMYATKEAIIAKEHDPEIDCHIFYMDMRASGRDFQDYYQRAKDEYGIRYVRSRPASIEKVGDTKNLRIRYETEDNELKEEEFDLVVLSVGLQAPRDLAEKFGIKLNRYGFCKTSGFKPLETSKGGIYVCGPFSEPKDIPESVAQGSGAAAKASALLSEVRGSMVTERKYPPEREIGYEEPRIGAFICHCGTNIGGVVNVPEVVEYARTLPGVAYAEENLYTCSQDTQERIKEVIRKYNLNRVVVASCTPRTHEPLFQNTIREAGLNPYLFEMANIRDQCSWVHMHESEKATEKAKDLTKMAIVKAALLKPLEKKSVEVIPSGLVIGGGVAGMTAALELATQGFKVHLVEKENELGGNMRNLHYTLNGEDPQKFLREIIGKINKAESIDVYTNAKVLETKGYVGNFSVRISHNDKEKTVDAGTIIIATGGIEYKPDEYLHGKDDRVITQTELEGRIAEDRIDSRDIVMIQCIGSRNDERSYCSRICCSKAIKNALKIKGKDPSANIFILYRDIVTYGFREEYYRKAREAGIIFIRYEDEKPEITTENSTIKISVIDPILKKKLILEPDLLVLSTAIVPNPDNEELSKTLKVPLTKDGFFLEAHVKLRPVDFATDGIFLCGLAHSPRSIDESISQAGAVASRASGILSKERLETEPITATVDEEICRGCGRCEEKCEFDAIRVVEREGRSVAEVNEVLCKGCGTCSVACPAGAITMRHFTNKQIFRMIESLAEVAG